MAAHLAALFKERFLGTLLGPPCQAKNQNHIPKPRVGRFWMQPWPDGCLSCSLPN